METQNITATLDCIKETTTFANRIITNVCNGTVTEIPIGFWDFVVGGFLGLLVVAIIIALIFLLKN